MTLPGLFEVLIEHETEPPRCALEEEYGVALRLDPDRVAVNFVSTIDGVVSFGLDTYDSRAVGGGVVADRTLMAMLRAVAGVIVIGAATLRACMSNHQWTPTALAPDRAHELAELRAVAGRPSEPAPLLVVSAASTVPREAAAVARPAVPVHMVAQPHGERLSAATIVEAARGLGGGGPILCEGGAHLFGTLLDGGVPVDLFLTVSPQLAGRSEQAPRRRSLVEGVDLAPFSRTGELRSVRQADEHLMLRYAIDARVPA